MLVWANGTYEVKTGFPACVKTKYLRGVYPPPSVYELSALRREGFACKAEASRRVS